MGYTGGRRKDGGDMQAVLLWKDMAQVADRMDKAVFQYVEAHQAESFEAFDTFDLLAFDW